MPLLIVTPATLGGILGLSVIIIVILITVVVLVTKIFREASQSTRPLQPEFHDGGGGNGTMDIEMKPNPVYGTTSAHSGQGLLNMVYGASDSV